MPGPFPTVQVRMKSYRPGRKIYLSGTTGWHFFLRGLNLGGCKQKPFIFGLKGVLNSWPLQYLFNALWLCYTTVQIYDFSIIYIVSLQCRCWRKVIIIAFRRGYIWLGGLILYPVLNRSQFAWCWKVFPICGGLEEKNGTLPVGKSVSLVYKVAHLLIFWKYSVVNELQY